MFRNFSLIIVLFCTGLMTLQALAQAELDAVKIRGATVFTQKQLVAVYVDLLGKTLSVDAENLLQERLYQVYQKDGWIKPLVRVQSNASWQNLLEIDITEARPTELSIEGFYGKSRVLVESLVNEYMSKVLKHSDIDNFELALKKHLGRSVSCTLVPVNGVFQMQIRPRMLGYLNVQVSNSAPEALGKEVLDIYAGINTAKTKLDVFASTSLKESVYQYLFASAERLLWHDWSMDVTGSYELAKPLSSFLTQQSQYSTLNFTLGSSIGDWGETNSGHRYRVSVGANNSEIETQGELVSDERLRSVGLQFNAWENSQQYSHWFRLGVSRGLDGLGAEVSVEQPYNEVFTHLQTQYSNVLNWKRWILQTDIVAQLAEGALPFSERFTLGGEYYLRAYEDGQLSGDSGALLQLQLGYQLGVDAHYFQPFLNYGYGKLFSEEFSDESAASFGGGVYWRFRELSITLEGHKQYRYSSGFESDEERMRFRINIGVRR